MIWFVLSFADGKQHLGTTVVEADDPEAAIRTAWAHGCNPGGEVVSVALPEGAEPPEGFPRYELLSRAWMEEHGGILTMDDLARNTGETTESP